MKNSIKNLIVLSVVTLTVVVNSCKKPKFPDDPCSNPVTVTALDASMYMHGHFSSTDNIQTMVWLHAINWNQFAKKVVPGRQYKIGYIETKCDDNDYYAKNNIVRGGCIVFPRKCIIIKCLMEIKQTGCRESVIDPPTFDDERSQAVSSSGITGNSLYARIGFSGCSEDENKMIKLYLSQKFARCGTPPRENNVFIAKAVNTYPGMVCMAYFEKNVCFDLTPVKNYYIKMNLPMPKEVTIRLMIGENSRDFNYTF